MKRREDGFWEDWCIIQYTKQYHVGCGFHWKVSFDYLFHVYSSYFISKGREPAYHKMLGHLIALVSMVIVLIVHFAFVSTLLSHISLACY